MPTIRDVAREAGVSATAVSYALSGSKKVSDGTRQLVVQTAARIGYHPSAAARNLKRRKTNTVGVFLPAFEGAVFGRILQSIHQELSRLQYEIVVCSTSLSERLLRERHVDGAIILNSLIPDETIRELQRPDYPIVVMERDMQLPYVSSVLADNEEGGFLAVNHLFAVGCRHVVTLSGNADSHENSRRLAGASRAFCQAGVECARQVVVQSGFSVEFGRRAMEKLLAQTPWVDGAFCLSDEMALGAMQAVKKTGRAIPQDIALVGYDDNPLAEYVEPSLTTIGVAGNAWGRTAAQVLYGMIQRQAEGAGVVVPVELLPRGSTRR